jgi:hypothetical protein
MSYQTSVSEVSCFHFRISDRALVVKSPAASPFKQTAKCCIDDKQDLTYLGIVHLPFLEEFRI